MTGSRTMPFLHMHSTEVPSASSYQISMQLHYLPLSYVDFSVTRALSAILNSTGSWF